MLLICCFNINFKNHNFTWFSIDFIIWWDMETGDNWGEAKVPWLLIKSKDPGQTILISSCVKYPTRIQSIQCSTILKRIMLANRLWFDTPKAVVARTTWVHIKCNKNHHPTFRVCFWLLESFVRAILQSQVIHQSRSRAMKRSYSLVLKNCTTNYRDIFFMKNIFHFICSQGNFGWVIWCF